MSQTTLHQETLTRLSLCKPLMDYAEKTKYVTETISESRQTIRASNHQTARLLLAQQSNLNPHSALLSAADSHMNGLEFLGLLRQKEAPDVFAEYANYEQLKRMRQAYIVHILDQVLSERTIVAWNNKAAQEEEDEEEEKIHGQRITLNNVFDLAEQEAKAEGKEDKEGEESESEDDAED